jgi:hypothetical protein
MSADFDKAIDRAVREMLDVEPNAGLRHRVMERLPASRSRLPGFSRLVASSFSWKIVLPVAAAAVLILALLLPRGGPQEPETTTVAAPPVVTPSTVQSPGRELRTAQGSAQSGQPARQTVGNVRRGDRVVAGVTYSPAAPAAGDIDPLQSLAPIQVAPVAQRAIAQPVITIPPLNPIADLEIAPLNPPERRN